MTPTFEITIKAMPTLNTKAAVSAYLAELEADHPVLAPYHYALMDVVNTRDDDVIHIFDVADQEIRLLFMPEIGRAALNRYQSGDWQWTDAHSPKQALDRYNNDDMRP